VRDGSKRVLIVDDDDAVRIMVERVLLREGFEVDSAHNGFEAIDKLTGNDYHAILLDLVMPGADGMDVLRFVEEMRPELRRAVIVMSAYASRATEAMHAGRVSRVLLKPFDLSELINKVRSSPTIENR
jgi:CheY-like chemotaxis protein